MINQQLLDYIKQQVQVGTAKEQIKNSLLTSGWPEGDIDEAFNIVSPVPIPPPPPMQANPAPAMSQPEVAALPGAWALFHQAWSLYQSRWGTFVGIMAIPVLVLTALAALMASLGFLGIFLLLSLKVFAVGGILLLMVLGILCLLFFVIAQAWGQTALLYALLGSQEKIGIRESYRRGWPKIGSYFWVGCLTGLILVGGILLAVIPGIIFVVWFSFGFFILIDEDLRGLNALLKSKEYVRGRWGSVAWRVLFIILVSIIISIILGMIVGIFKIPLGAIIVRVINGLFVAPLTLTYTFLLYKNLKTLRGEFVFAPTAKARGTFIIIAILVPLFAVVMGIWGFSRFRMGTQRPQYPQYPINLNNTTQFPKLPPPIY